LSKLLSFGCLFPNKYDYKTQKEQSEYFYKLKLEIEENILPAIEAAVNEKEMKYVLDNDEFIDWLRDHPKIKADLKNNQLKRMIETYEFKYWLNEHPEIKATVIEKHMECVSENKDLMLWLQEYLDPKYFEVIKSGKLLRELTIESQPAGQYSFEEWIALEIFDFIINKKELGNAHRCKTCGNYFLWHYENKKICSVYCRGKKWYDAHKKKGRKRIA
jgi:phenolic acid decarboxylase